MSTWNGELCRLCLSRGASQKLWPDAAEALFSCYTIKIKPKSNLPDKICDKCLLHVKEARAFSKACLNAQLALDIVVKNMSNLSDEEIQRNLYEMYEKICQDQKSTVSQTDKLKLEKGGIPSKKNLNPNRPPVSAKRKDSKRLKKKSKTINVTDRKIKILPRLLPANKIETLNQTHLLLVNKNMLNSSLIPISIGSGDFNVKNNQLGLPINSEKIDKVAVNSSTDFQCKICKKRLSTELNYQMHMEEMHSDVDLRTCCFVCNIRFQNQNELTQHNISVHFQSTFDCDICKKEYKQKHLLRRHNENHHPTQILKINCSKCNNNFSTLLELQLHQSNCKETLNLTNTETVNSISQKTKDKIECNLCKLAFDEPKDLANHMESHVTNVCEYCNQGFIDAVYLFNHVAEKHNTKKNPYFCLHCTKMYSVKKFLLKHHQERHKHSQETFYCGHCDYNELHFNNLFELWKHLESVHKSSSKFDDITTNIVIEKTSSSENIVYSNLDSDKGNIQYTQDCLSEDTFAIVDKNEKYSTSCLKSDGIYIMLEDKSIKKGESLLKPDDSQSLDVCNTKMEHYVLKNIPHLVIPENSTKTASDQPDGKHNSVENTVIEKTCPSFQCKLCSKKYVKLIILQNHYVNAHGSDSLNCLGCEFKATNGANLKLHIKTCIEFWKLNNVSCATCGKKFTTSSGLRYHMKVHSSDKKCICPICNKSFMTIGHLNAHTRAVHSQDRPFMCSSCPKTFAMPDHLRKHMKSVHIGQRDYVCPICNHTYAQSSHLTQHMWIHTGVKPYECSFCPNKYTTKCALTKHLSRHHREQQLKQKTTEEFPNKNTSELDGSNMIDNYDSILNNGDLNFNENDLTEHTTVADGMEDDLMEGYSVVIVGE